MQGDVDVPFVETDRRILNRCLNREPGAWEEFVDRFIGAFLHVIRHTAHARSVQLSQADVDDLCSEIFVALLKNDFAVLRHFKGRSALATYLTVVARRIVVKSIAQRRKLEAMGHVAAHRSALQAGGVEPGTALADADEVRALMQQLPEAESRLIRLFYLDGKSYEEIGRILGISVNSIGPTLQRARERMKQIRIAAAG